LSHDLVLTIQKKDRSGVRSLLECGIDPLAQDSDGRCGLHHAVRAGSKRVLRELLGSAEVKRNAKGIDAKDKTGATSLHHAASFGETGLAKELLQAGADKDALDNHDRSPLFMAVQGNHKDIVELLLDRKAKVTPNLPRRFKEMQSAINFRRRMEAKKAKLG
jgi:ankyrin repeat protein